MTALSTIDVADGIPELIVVVGVVYLSILSYNLVFNQLSSIKAAASSSWRFIAFNHHHDKLKGIILRQSTMKIVYSTIIFSYV
jgi:hypothetical protein